jgi:hypothetical protein
MKRFILLLVLFVGCKFDQNEELIPPLVEAVAPDTAAETFAALHSADPPERDLADLTARLKGIAVELPAPKRNVMGDVEQFNVLEGSDVNRLVSAELRYQSDIINMWFEEGVRLNADDLAAAAQVLEEKIIPTMREFFGNEPSPGIDGDPRINFLHVKDLGGQSAGTVTAGYFSGSDRYPASANQFSNEREMLYISLSASPLNSDDYFQVIAHEIQHLVQSATDTNESSWTDEGLAELSAYVNGYNEVDSVASYVDLTDVQLTDWQVDTNEDIAHYGASFLFAAYFLDRFGHEATKALVREPENGLLGYQATLDGIGAGISAETLFADWVIANYLASRDAGSGVYQYDGIDVPPIRHFADHRGATELQSGAVYQFGADFIRVQSEDAFSFEFTGSGQVQLLPTNPHSGDYFVTTYPADRSDMTLTRAFDLTAAEQTTTTLSFWSWYDIEAGWDYVYLLASADNGATWQMLPSLYSTKADPHGNNFGTALTGYSTGGLGKALDAPEWTEISVDLTEFVGENILVRFEYVTDDAVNLAGMAIDDISLPAIGYLEDFESGLGGWEVAGWVRHANILQQQYLIQAIYLLDGTFVDIERFELAATNRTTLPIGGRNFDEVVLAISGTTPVTTQRAAYRYQIIQP